MTIRKITFEGNEKLAVNAIDLARKFANRVNDTRDKMGVRSYTRSMDLPDGTTLFANSFLGANDEVNVYTHIIAPQTFTTKIPDTEEDIPFWESVGIADYVCGYVYSPLCEEITKYEGEDYEREALINTHVVQTSTGEDRIPEEWAHEKMGVPISYRLAMPDDFSLSGAIYSQHRRVKPGNYSGRMKQVVQLLLGMGDVVHDTYERRELINPIHTSDLSSIDNYYGSEEDYIESESKLAPSAFNLYKVKTAAPTRTEVGFDYRAHRTHGLSWGPQEEGKPHGRCYVIQISTKGVHAMPLELDPITTTERGKAQLEKLYPEMFERDDLYDWLGGMPTGRPFPIMSDIDKYVRAGEVVELLDAAGMGEFIGTSWYSFSYGWSFDKSGTRASITSYDYDADLFNIKRGYLWTTKFDIDSTYEERTVNPRATAVIAALGLTETWEIKKAYRLSDQDTDTILRDPAGIDFDADFTVEAPFSGSASLFEEMRGYLYFPGNCYHRTECYRSVGHPQFKFADEALGLHSTVCMNAEEYIEPEDQPVCNTPIWVGYKGDQQVIVHYWYVYQDPGKASYENTRQECQIEGSWEEITRSGNSRIMGSFYSTEFDFRALREFGSYQYVKVNGKHAGTYDYQAFSQYFGNCTSMRRHVLTEFTREGESYQDAVTGIYCTALFHERNLYCMLELTTKTGNRTWTSVNTENMGTTGYVRHGYVYNFLFHWSGGCPPGKKLIGNADTNVLCELLPSDSPPAGLCSSLTRYGAPEFFRYDPRNGNIIYSSVYSGSSIHNPGYYNTTTAENSFKWKVHLGGDRPMGVPEVIEQEEISGENYDIYDTTLSHWWFISSPTLCNDGSWQGASQNHWGDMQLNIETQPSGFTTVHYGAEAMQTSVYSTYVGYVGE
jgi:hypothetical protein